VAAAALGERVNQLRRGVPILAALIAIGTTGLVAHSSTVTVTATVSTAIVTDTFSGATPDATGWVKPTAFGVGTNVACMNAGSNPGAVPIPGCNNNTGLTSALQLTSATSGQEGAVAYDTSVATTSAIDATFWTEQTGGSAADGITFFLAASNPGSPTSSNITLGPGGGSLAYAQAADLTAAGMTNAYLGVGLDVYGNFHNVNAAGTDCTAAAQAPQRVDVRGPGSGTSGYCLLNSALATGSLWYLPPESFARQANPNVSTDPFGGGGVPVEVVINPTAHAVTTASGRTVPSGTYRVAFTSLGAGEQELNGPLPDATNYLPDGWANGNGIPKRLTFGWTAATGDQNDDHLLADVNITAISDPGTTECPAGQTCSATATDPDTGETATIRATGSGPDTVITATYGGDVDPLRGCAQTTADDILTFSGDRPKTIVLDIPADKAKRAIVLFCYGQPTPFVTLNGRLAKYHAENGDYEGFLPACVFLRAPGPCIQSINWQKNKGERAVIKSATADPHLAH
jgi:hypothetical protein